MCKMNEKSGRVLQHYDKKLRIMGKKLGSIIKNNTDIKTIVGQSDHISCIWERSHGLYLTPGWWIYGIS